MSGEGRQRESAFHAVAAFANAKALTEPKPRPWHCFSLMMVCAGPSQLSSFLLDSHERPGSTKSQDSDASESREPTTSQAYLDCGHPGRKESAQQRTTTRNSFDSWRASWQWCMVLGIALHALLADTFRKEVGCRCATLAVLLLASQKGLIPLLQKLLVAMSQQQ